MKVVSNTTTLIGLAVIERFDLLQQLFGRISIPQAVYDEAVTFGRENGGAKREVLSADWIDVIRVKDRLAVDVLLDELDLGEAETIVLARELIAAWVLMDERKGRKIARDVYNLKVVGSARILVEAKRKSLIDNVENLITGMRNGGYRIHDSIVDAILKEAGER